MTRPTVVLTGASAGIGAAAAVQLARAGADLVLLGRSPTKLAAVAERVSAGTGARPTVLACDFADLADVRRVGTELAASHDGVDVLVNNAGLLARRRVDTVDGHELTIQVNHLAPYLLTSLLLPALSAAGGRVVTTSSSAHVGGRLDVDDLDLRRRRWQRWRAYADSKQANVLHAVELSRRLADVGGTAVCLHPGVVRSEFGRGSTVFRAVTALAPVGVLAPSQAAAALVELATCRIDEVVPGGYYDRTTPARAARRAVDPALAARLWSVSAALTTP